MVRTREELLTDLNAVIGENTTDESLSFIENLTDTFNEMSQNGAEDWKKKYEENDASWRKKYRDRFLTGSSDPDEDHSDLSQKAKSFESLFS